MTVLLAPHPVYGDSSIEVTVCGRTVLLDLASSGANGLDVGSVSTDQWYHVHELRSCGGTLAVLASSSLVAPSVPSGYEQIRRLGSVKTDSTGKLKPWKQTGNLFEWLEPSVCCLVTDPGTDAIVVDLCVPPDTVTTAKVIATINNPSSSVTYGYFSSLATKDVPPSTVINQTGRVGNTSGATIVSSATLDIPTNTSGQIRSRLNSSPSGVILSVKTVGWLEDGEIDQSTADLQTRSQAPINKDTFSITGRALRNISDITGRFCNIIFIGQSTNNNSVDGSTPTPANPTNLFNLSLSHPMKTQIFQAKEPLLTSDLTQGHHGLPLADALVTGDHCDNVVLTQAACGGSYAADYAPGGGVVGGNQAGTRTGSLAYRIGLAARSIANAGLWDVPTIIDWQQGEWDSDGTPTTYANHKMALEKIIAEFKRVGLLRPGNVMFIHKCTRISNSTTNRNIIRQAQADVVDGDLVRAGADIDTLGSSYRPDGTHFSAAGAVAQANLKLPLITDFLANG